MTTEDEISRLLDDGCPISEPDLAVPSVVGVLRAKLATVESAWDDLESTVADLLPDGTPVNLPDRGPCRVAGGLSMNAQILVVDTGRRHFRVPLKILLDQCPNLGG